MQANTLRKNLTIGLMALGVTVGVILILLALRPQLPSVTPSYSMSVLDAVQLAPVAKPVEVPAVSRVDMDWQFGLNCKAEGMRTWTHEDASGTITFYCKP